MERIKKKLDELEKRDYGTKFIIIMFAFVLLPFITFIIGVTVGFLNTMDTYIGMIDCQAIFEFTENNHFPDIFERYKDRCGLLIESP